eukprot:5674416-Amphidinium_carterae.1
MTEDEITKVFCECPVGLAKGDAALKTHVMCYYDQSEGGECSAQPHLRVPSLRGRGAHLGKFMTLMMARHGGKMHGQDVYVVNDNGREGNKGVILNSFTSSDGTPISKKATRTLMYVLSEESLVKRRAAVRGFSAVDQASSLPQNQSNTPKNRAKNNYGPGLLKTITNV